MSKKVISILLSTLLAVTAVPVIKTSAKVQDIAVSSIKTETTARYVKANTVITLTNAVTREKVKAPAGTIFKLLSVSGTETNGVATVLYKYNGVTSAYTTSTRYLTPINFVWIY